MVIEFEFLEQFCESVLSDAPSLRWAGIANHNGVILSQKTRSSTTLLLSHEENEEYATNAIARQKTRGKFESQIGRLTYAFGRYQKLLRATIPINAKLFLLVTFDPSEHEFDSIITDRILKKIDQSKDRFLQMSLD